MYQHYIFKNTTTKYSLTFNYNQMSPNTKLSQIKQV
jgi:hypothetical protein